MSAKYTVMFTAGGRLRGTKVSATEKAAMHAYLTHFHAIFPKACIHEELGMAVVELTDEEKTLLEASQQILYIRPFKCWTPMTIQSNAPWHLANISNSEYGSYEYATTGKGVTVYIGDTGVDIDNPEFEGRAVHGLYQGVPTDPHGTHVAGIVGSKTYGVAKECKIVNIQIFDPTKDSYDIANGGGSIYLLDGLNWILAHHPAGTPGVLNLSIGGACLPEELYQYADVDAMLALIEDGIVVIAAAGNETLDISNGGYHPGGVTEIITVGAIDADNKIATFSNYGSIIDIFAPGVAVTSTVLDLKTDSFNGTSMAAPVVAGVVARYLELCPGTTPVEMQAYIKEYGNHRVNLAGALNTTTAGIQADMPGRRASTSTTLSDKLFGDYRLRYDNAGVITYGPYVQFGEKNRRAVMYRYSYEGEMLLASEVTKYVDIIVPNPIVVPPVVLPADVAYDGGTIVFNVGFSVTFKGMIYMPSTHIGNVYTYDYVDVLNMTVLVGDNNVYTITTISQLAAPANPRNYDGGVITFNPDYTISFKGITYQPTAHVGNVYTYNYPGTIVVTRNNDTNIITTTPQLAVPVPVNPGDTLVFADGSVTVNADDTITYNGITYTATSNIDGVLIFDYAGIILLTIDHGSLTTPTLPGVPIVVPDDGSNTAAEDFLLAVAEAAAKAEAARLAAEEATLALASANTAAAALALAIAKQEEAAAAAAAAQALLDAASTAEELAIAQAEVEAANLALATAIVDAATAKSTAIALATEASIAATTAKAAALTAAAAAATVSIAADAAAAAALLAMQSALGDVIIEAAYQAAVIAANAAANAAATAQTTAAAAATAAANAAANAAAIEAATTAAAATAAALAAATAANTAIAAAANVTVAANAARIAAAKAAANAGSSSSTTPPKPVIPVVKPPTTGATAVIPIDFANPKELASYQLSLQRTSGTFNYTGANTLPQPACKTAATIQGHGGMVERVSKVAKRGSAPVSVDGRLLPVFTSELVYISRVEQTNGTPYETQTVVADVAALAGASVAFSATNTKMHSFTFAGNIIAALEQLAEASCGELLQQNGQFFILPKHTPKGSFAGSVADLIGCESSVQSDVADMLASLLGSLKDAILDRDQAIRELDRIQNQLDMVSISESLPSDPKPKNATWSNESWQSMGEITFTFGHDGKIATQMHENILVEAHPAVDAWDYWELEMPNAKAYHKKEITYEPTTMGAVKRRNRGLKTLEMVNLFYPITPPANAGLFRAKGELLNLDCSLWAGTKDMFASMSPVLKSVSVTAAGGVVATPFNVTRTYFQFSRSIFASGFATEKSFDNKKMFLCRMDLEYLPTSSMPWKFSVSIDKNYRLIQGVKFLIPIAGGPVLNKNGNTVAQFDRTGRVIKLQNGLIVSNVTCDADTPPILQPDGSYSDVVKGMPTNCTAPVTTDTGTAVTIVGAVNKMDYVLRTTAGRFFGTVNADSGMINDINGSNIGTYDTWSFNPTGSGVRWTNSLGFVHSGLVVPGSGVANEVIGVVQGAADPAAGGSISFGNSVDYPIASADTNYTSLQSTIYGYEKAKLLVSKEIAIAKVTCIKKELNYYGVNYDSMITACDSWKLYYDAIELRDYPRVVKPPAVAAVPKTETEIKLLETDAITLSNQVQMDASSIKREHVVSASFLYRGTLPLPGQSFSVPTVTTVNGAVPNGSGIIDSVSLSGHNLTISARQVE